MKLSKDFEAFLKDTGIKFAHRNREQIYLHDLFVYPDLKPVRESLDEMPAIISSENLWEYGERLLIFGSEQSGKTTLAKRLFLDAFSKGFSPLIIPCSTIGNYKIIDEQIQKLIPETYHSLTADEFLQNSNLVCIVDDISAMKMNKKARKQFINSLNSIFAITIIFAEESFQFITPDFPELDEYKRFELVSFGNLRRSQLIEKWVDLELAEEVDDQKIWAKKDELRHHVDSLVGKSIVPAKPCYILMFLQSFETITLQRFELTYYGHCYQYLIYQALERSDVKQNEIDTYLNILSEIGGALLESSSENLNDLELDAFFEKYSESFLSCYISKLRIIKIAKKGE
jgi:hypothetical protein